MRKRSKNILIGLTAVVLLSSAGLLIAKGLKHRKKEAVEAETRAENAYSDSLTEKDIAWG
jgi:flagellar basal body-associated protein FliL